MDLSKITSVDNTPVCLYCKVYQQIQQDYPVNPATFRTDSEVPRCEVHSQYTCDQCNRDFHFNGIAYCNSCTEFTCLRCGSHEVKSESFFVYDYYYNITCTSCDACIPTLDYTEITGSHPFQIGAIRPTGDIRVWLPFGKEVAYKPEFKQWGLTRLREMTSRIKYESVDEVKGDSKQVWDSNAEIWKDRIRAGDVNHLEIIIPEMIEYLDNDKKIVMDVACGEGTFTRKLANRGYEVTGTDISNLIDYAMENEKEQTLGIVYKKIGVHDLRDEYDEGVFQQVTMNMAIMNIDNLDGILDNVSYILEPGGNFIFSLTHPVTAWPTVRTIKLPTDSEHNEDKGWLLDDYALEQPTKIHLPDLPSPMLYYPRKISTYVNTLVNNGFSIKAMSEPVPDENIIKKYPRDMYRDYDRNPIFMVIKAKLI